MHQPVLLQETISHLITNPQGTYIDCTLGGGGHLKYLLQNLSPGARVLALDKDRKVMERTRGEIKAANVTFIHSDFRELSSILLQQGLDKVDGIMLDLGVSSFQLDTVDRGFSFHADAFLDMRMNPEQKLSAWDIVNKYSQDEIVAFLFQYGEERYARKIARAIESYRQERPVNTTLELVEIIKGAVPARYSREKHPARKTFQALRIAVNGELEALQAVLPQAVDALQVGGRLCVITFHSLEDRIVKRFFQGKARNCICPPGQPICNCNHKAELSIITRKPLVATEEENQENPRARSAKLRVAAKL